MSRICRRALCSESQALVLVEVIPLCQAGPLDILAMEAAVLAASPSAFDMHEELAETAKVGLPARCVAVMPCAAALALVEGTGDVVL